MGHTFNINDPSVDKSGVPSWLAAPPTDDDGDLRPLMVYVAGWMCLGVGVVGVGGAAIPSLRFHPGWQVGLGMAAILYGAVRVADPRRGSSRPIGVHVLGMALALPVVAVGLWATGGPHSYLLPLALLAPIHWAFFLDRARTVGLLCAGLLLTMWTQLADRHAQVNAEALSSLALRSATVLVLAAAVVAIRKRLRAAEDRLREQSRLDPLTGLLNRRGFTSELDRLLQSPPPYGQRPMLIVLDLDDLKAVNDSFGHPVGDQVLRVFAQRLSASLRRDDIAARLGGDEFAVAGLVPDEAVASEIAARLTRAVRGQLDISPPVPVAATAGWALLEVGEVGSTFASEELMVVADRCLLANKQQRLLSLNRIETPREGTRSRWRLSARPSERPSVRSI